MRDPAPPTLLAQLPTLPASHAPRPNARGATPRTLLDALCARRSLDVEGIFTHFHSADCEEAASKKQLALFQRVLHDLDQKDLRPRTVHAVASDALLAFPEAHFDMVRPGTALYGLQAGFDPVLSWKTAVAHVNHLEAGETVSYGATWTAPAAREVAAIPVGWADGLAAGAARFEAVLIHGVRCPIVGSITMDQAMVDVTALGARGVKVGDEVVLLGAQGRDAITAAEAATWLGDVHPVVVTTKISNRSPSAALPLTGDFQGWTFSPTSPRPAR